VAEQVHLVEPEVRPQRLDVPRHPVAAVRRRVGRNGRGAGPPQLEEDKLAVRKLADAAQVAEVCRVPPRAAGQAHQRAAGTLNLICQPGAVVGGEEFRHASMVTRSPDNVGAVSRRADRNHGPFGPN
jgi:hypothetical protein